VADGADPGPAVVASGDAEAAERAEYADCAERVASEPPTAPPEVAPVRPGSAPDPAGGTAGADGAERAE
jgi:hypothetical protein